MELSLPIPNDPKSLKYYRDLKNVLDTAWEEGKMEEKIAVIRNGHKQGLSTALLAALTGLDEETVKKILEKG